MYEICGNLDESVGPCLVDSKLAKSVDGRLGSVRGIEWAREVSTRLPLLILVVSTDVECFTAIFVNGVRWPAGQMHRKVAGK